MREMYSGKAKTVYDNGDEVIIEFRDDITAFDSVKQSSIKGKGFYNAQTSAKLFEFLERNGVRTHYLGMEDDARMKAEKVEIIPLEVIVRNIAAGSITRNYPIKGGTIFENPVVIFDLKDDKYHDPMVNEDIVEILGLATWDELKEMREKSLRINSLLREFFEEKKIKLVDFKLEFGRHRDGIILADEISCDTCRFWNEMDESLDKDLYRFDKGDVLAGYKKVYKLLKG